MTEVEEEIFAGDCRGGCMHNQGCENEKAAIILQRILHTWQIELLLTVLPSLKEKRLSKTQLYDG